MFSFASIVAEPYIYVFVRIMEITMIKEDVGQWNETEKKKRNSSREAYCL